MHREIIDFVEKSPFCRFIKIIIDGNKSCLKDGFFDFRKS